MDSKDWKRCWKFTNIIVLVFKPLEILVRYNIRKGMERLLTNLNIDTPNIIELGSGTGRDSEWLIKKFGGKSTLVDNCDYIISKSRAYFKRKDLDITYIKSNVESLPLQEKYDLVFSVGLVEHFYNQGLYNIFKKHVDLAKEGRYIMIFVPHNAGVYHFYKKLLMSLKLWVWDEQSFTINDLQNLGTLTNSTLLRTTEVIGGMWLGALYKKS